MLAKRRSIKLHGTEIERTPLLVPSFSSKGFPDVKKIISYCSEVIEGVSLVSAYDIYYEKINPPFDFASLLFLDSGGYEASKDTELSDLGEKDHIPKLWTQEMHEDVIASWRPTVPSVLISYDHPKQPVKLDEQIKRALHMAPGRPEFIREFLIKPETDTQHYLQISEVIKYIHRFAEFDIIGVTEKEIGNSLVERITNIALLRQALTKAGLETPIHVFGSLDTISTPLYFLAGADIFDGLTWLRFAYHEGLTIYKHNFGALKLGLTTKTQVIDGRCWNQNYYYITEMQLEMRRFLGTNDYTAFKYHADLFRVTLESAMEALGGRDGR